MTCKQKLRARSSVREKRFSIGRIIRKNPFTLNIIDHIIFTVSMVTEGRTASYFVQISKGFMRIH